MINDEETQIFKGYNSLIEGSLKITSLSPFKETIRFLSWVFEGSEAEFKEFERDYMNILVKKSIKEV